MTEGGDLWKLTSMIQAAGFDLFSVGLTCSSVSRPERYNAKRESYPISLHLVGDAAPVHFRALWCAFGVGVAPCERDVVYWYLVYLYTASCVSRKPST
jgi:hypothetical protein